MRRNRKRTSLTPFYERVQWQQQLRGITGPTEKEIADDLAIGGLRNTAETVSRLSYSAEFGIKLGSDMQAALRSEMDEHRAKGTLQDSWVYQACKIIGSKKEEKKRPPAQAVEAVKALIVKHVQPPEAHDHIPLTLIDAILLEAWRVAAKDPDDPVGPWLKTGGPAGILIQALCPEIFPDVAAPADWMPEDLHCDQHAF